jgi:hypothetical protein
LISASAATKKQKAEIAGCILERLACRVVPTYSSKPRTLTTEQQILLGAHLEDRRSPGDQSSAEIEHISHRKPGTLEQFVNDHRAAFQAQFKGPLGKDPFATTPKFPAARGTVGARIVVSAVEIRPVRLCDVHSSDGGR